MRARACVGCVWVVVASQLNRDTAPASTASTPLPPLPPRRRMADAEYVCLPRGLPGFPAWVKSHSKSNTDDNPLIIVPGESAADVTAKDAAYRARHGAGATAGFTRGRMLEPATVDNPLVIHGTSAHFANVRVEPSIHPHVVQYVIPGGADAAPLSTGGDSVVMHVPGTKRNPIFFFGQVFCGLKPMCLGSLHARFIECAFVSCEKDGATDCIFDHCAEFQGGGRSPSKAVFFCYAGDAPVFGTVKIDVKPVLPPRPHVRLARQLYASSLRWSAAAAAAGASSTAVTITAPAEAAPRQGRPPPPPAAPPPHADSDEGEPEGEPEGEGEGEPEPEPTPAPAPVPPPYPPRRRRSASHGG